MRIRTLALLATLALPAPLLATSYTYTYTGNDFNYFAAVGEPQVYTASDFVTIQFTLSAPLTYNPGGSYVTPTSFSASDGVQTITNTSANLYDYSFQFFINGSGAIAAWNVYVYTESGGVFDEIGSDSGGQDYGLFNDTPQTGYVDEGRAESLKASGAAPPPLPNPLLWLF
jgi:hypothetical protein